MAEDLSPNEAIDKLAERLYSYIERLDPTGAADWDDLDDGETTRDLFRAVIRDLVRFEAWVARAQDEDDNGTKARFDEPQSQPLLMTVLTDLARELEAQSSKPYFVHDDDVSGSEAYSAALSTMSLALSSVIDRHRTGSAQR
ncbi:MAG: hypothetical protein AAF739_00450 [Pseudomonadota bacterium]